MNQDAVEIWTKQLIASYEYDKACAVILTFFECTKIQPSELWDLLRQAFRGWVRQTSSSNQRSACLESVLCTLNKDRHHKILKLIGTAECEKKNYTAGNYYLSEAWKIAPWSAATFALLCSYRNSMVSRWHFRMLNDITRNNVYRTAIKNVVRDLKSKLNRAPIVLDVGMGTGLLGLYAVEAGATVIGCDNDTLMFSIANKVIKSNSMTTQCCHSDDVVAENIDIILTETLDALGLGENILESTYNASQKWNVLRCIPEQLTLFSSLVQSEMIHSAHFSCDSLYDYRSSVGTETDPYDCEFVDGIDDLIWMSQPTKILEVNIGKDLLAAETRLIPFVSTVTGFCHGIITYFDLTLCHSVTLTSAPSSIPSDFPKASCWEQAFHPLPERSVRVGEVVTVLAHITSNSIIITWPDNGESAKHKVLDNREFWEVMSQSYCRCYSRVLNKIPRPSETHVDGNISTDSNASTESNASAGTVVYDPLFSLLITPEGILSDNPMYTSVVKSFQIYGCLIECDKLDQWTKVDDKNTLGVNVSSLMNCYQTLRHQDFLWPQIPHTKLSNHVLLLTSPVKSTYCEYSRDDLMTLYSTKISSKTTFNCITAGIATALVIWYNIDFFGGESFNSLEEPNWKRVAIMFVERPRVTGQCSLTIHHKHGDVCVSELKCL